MGAKRKSISGGWIDRIGIIAHFLDEYLLVALEGALHPAAAINFVVDRAVEILLGRLALAIRNDLVGEAWAGDGRQMRSAEGLRIAKSGDEK